MGVCLQPMSAAEKTDMLCLYELVKGGQQSVMDRF